jgi:pilus assembly protein CpaB
MARPLTKVAGGTTSRRLLLLLALVAGIVAAILVYTALSRNSESTSGDAGATATMAPVVVAKQDIPARTKITASMVEVRQMPLDDASELAFTDLSDAVGRVTRYPIATSEQVLSTKVVALESAAVTGDSLSYVIPDGRRAMAINVDEVVAVGGLVLPGDYVDVMAVFDVTFRDGESEKTENKYFTRLILQNIEVLAVAQTVVDAPPEAGTATGSDAEAGAAAPETTGEQRARNTEAEPEPKAATVTLSLTPQEAQLIFLAEENGVIRMAVRPYGDSAVQNIPFVAEPELIPPDLPGPVLR